MGIKVVAISGDDDTSISMQISDETIILGEKPTDVGTVEIGYVDITCSEARKLGQELIELSNKMSWPNTLG